MMSNLQFKCTLLSDVIINQKAATEGNRETADFIPGGNFLGIAAGALYNEIEDVETKNLLFHSGKVCFGDAHPALNGFRTVRIPASFYVPKGSKPVGKDCCFVHHAYSREHDEAKRQLKQCQKGFYRFDKKTAAAAIIPKTFALKSAYDRNLRKAQDEQMYGYQSMDKGITFYFEVTIDNQLPNKQIIEQQIEKALTGTRHIGRSRTAQYGLVDIVKESFDTPCSSRVTDENKDLITVYADGRLIFLDDVGMSCFTPKPEQLGFAGGTIYWEKSQIRTFQYAPWNGKRQARDADRCGIEKGSVFVLSLPNAADLPHALPEYVGNYRSEGFGKVIVNPDFLETRTGTNGLSGYLFEQEKNNTENSHHNPEAGDMSAGDATLLAYLELKLNDTTPQLYKEVNDFVTRYTKLFTQSEETFASQWGTIRSIAVQCADADRETLIRKVFDEYIDRGIAKDKWSENGRSTQLKEFIYKSMSPQSALINLAAEMAKKCSSK